MKLLTEPKNSQDSVEIQFESVSEVNSLPEYPFMYNDDNWVLSACALLSFNERTLIGKVIPSGYTRKKND